MAKAGRHPPARLEHVDGDRGAIGVEGLRRGRAHGRVEVGVADRRHRHRVAAAEDGTAVDQGPRGHLLEEIGEDDDERPLRRLDPLERADVVAVGSLGSAS